MVDLITTLNNYLIYNASLSVFAFFLFLWHIYYIGIGKIFRPVVEVSVVILFKNIKKPKVLIFDAEYNEGDLIQFSGILFRNINKELDLFQIEKSLLVYCKPAENYVVNPFIERFTGITSEFLNKKGISLEETSKLVASLLDFPEECIVVSHGVSNDRQVLLENGIDLYENNNKDDRNLHVHHGTAGLDRNKSLSLKDVAAEAGLFLGDGHNAYNDALITACVLSFYVK